MDSNQTKLLDAIHKVEKKVLSIETKLDEGVIQKIENQGVNLNNKIENLKIDVDANTKFKNTVVSTVALSVLGALITLVLV